MTDTELCTSTESAIRIELDMDEIDINILFDNERQTIEYTKLLMNRYKIALQKYDQYEAEIILTLINELNAMLISVNKDFRSLYKKRNEKILTFPWII